ncbi:hypothetical protein M3936_03660 [Sutcliffiella horikoshii]|uniref:hypothetical protein n=1 Tax=Sutcliffiella horikoshii TaxID=79883 RepID=UPI00203ED53D|nr:hypothetical protein [Sutcliffiella horikoshii]MCM3616673.1 hypothetical protein [Sutcliffiella horikoshii]
MAINNQIGRDVRNTLNDIETIKTIAEEAKVNSDQAKKAVENVDVAVEKANNAATSVNDVVRLVNDKMVELEGVDAVQFKERQDTFDAQLAQKAQQSALEIEKQRINNLIALPQGATTNDARLEDIKIGYDGTVYNSPGDAVRAIGAFMTEDNQVWVV